VRRHPEEIFTLPFTGAATFSIRGGVALGMSGGAEQSDQLFVFVRDEVGESRAQFLDDGVDSLN
jgi:hypothetical protein